MSSRASETDFYAILEVSSGASAPEIKESYRRLVRLNHPDANPLRREECEQRIKTIIEAYTILGDPLRRERYDANVRLHSWEEKTGVAKAADTPSSGSLISRVRSTLGLSVGDLAARLGLSEAALSEMEQKDDVPQSPIQLRTFTQLCESAAKQLEAEGRSSFAADIRTLLNRKKTQRTYFR